MKTERRTYTAEFKREAVRLATERGNLSAVARELGLHPSMLREWKRRQLVGLSSDRRSMKYMTCFCLEDHPIWEDVEHAIRLLDQDLHTEVTLSRDYERSEYTYMDIGGGRGDYWVFIMISEGEGWQTYDESKPDEEIGVRCGGQAIDVNMRNLLGLDETLIAAKHYFETGEPSPLINWS